jgi:Tol biopolymer transport system component
MMVSTMFKHTVFSKLSRRAILLAALVAPFLLAHLADNLSASSKLVAAQTQHQVWRIAFDRLVTPGGRVLDGPSPADIFAVDTEGGAELKLTKDDRSSHPVWSPDGRKIAYIHQGTQAGLYVMDANGSNQQWLALVPGILNTLAWSPDGKKLAFDVITPAMQQGGGNHLGGIYVFDLAHDATPQLFVKEGAAPSWSPDGTRIAYTCASGAAPADFKLAACILAVDNNKSTPVVVAKDAGGPVWSPDGRQFLYVSFSKEEFALSVSNADGSGAHQLTHGHTAVLSAQWSPDGRRIAFTSTPFEEKRAIEPRASVINADGGSGAVPLGHEQDLRCDQLSWSPDGAFLAGICVSGLGNSGRDGQQPANSLYLLNANDPKSEPRVLVHNVFHHAEFSPKQATN